MRYTFMLQRYSGEAPTIDLDWLVALMLSANQSVDLQSTNQFLPIQLHSLISQSTSALLLRINRLGLIDRAIAQCNDVLRLTDEIRLIEKTINQSINQSNKQ